MAALSQPLIILIGFLGLINHAGSQQGSGIHHHTPKDCSREPLPVNGGGGRYGLVCRLRTVNSEFDRTNFSVIPPAGTVALTILCDQNIDTESRLLENSFDHLVQLEELQLKHCNLRNIPPGSFDGLTNLRNLTINTFSDKQLEFGPGVVRSLGQLARLDLSHSALEALAAGGQLCNLTALTHLNISNNRLPSLSSVGLGSCDLGLGLLDVSSNSIRTINGGDFQSLTHLRALLLANNKIVQVHEEGLKGLGSLRTLDLSDNSIVALPAALFQDTPQLQQLKLNNNRLSVLSSRLFQPLAELVVLDLSANNLETPCLSCPEQPCQSCLSVRTFSGLSKLVILNLSHNKIKYLTPDLFKDLGTLQILDLSSNQLETLPPSAFKGLRNLHTLKLSNNLIAEPQFQSFSGVFSLNTLDLENNSISAIHEQAFANLSVLQDLNLFNNRLGGIPAAALAQLRGLKTLDLGANGITELEGSALGSGLSGLIGLKLDENSISQVSKASLANLTNLQILNLAGNSISRVEMGSFTKNTKLQAIRLDENRITDIVGLFSGLQNLRWLNISDNQIEKFDYFLLPLSLNWLDLHKNNIEEIGNYFNKESEINIHTMDISFNKIKTISGRSIPDRIQILSLNDNLITRVDPLTFAAKSRLVRVDLYANQIIKLETSSLSLPAAGAGGVDKRPDFYLGGNPFLCDCNLEWLKSINVLEGAGGGARNPVVRDLESIYCKLIYSQDNVYIPLVEAKPSDFLCSYSAHCPALCHCCDYDACDCEMTCPDNCTCYHDQMWTRNIVSCASSGFSEPPTAIPMDATQVYLHGNNFPILSSHSFIGRKKLRVLYLNNSNIEAVLNYTFFGLRLLEELHLDHNAIGRLEGVEFQSLHGLKSLYLHHNLISWIEPSTFTHLDSLERLTLHHNRLFAFPGHFSLAANPFLIELSLADNPWSCGCSDVLTFNHWLLENKEKVLDLSKIACYPNNSQTPALYIIEGRDCKYSDSVTLVQAGINLDYLPFIIVAFSILTVVGVGLGVVVYYRVELRVWVFSQWGARLCYASPPADADTEKMYDAYITYSLKDEHFVNQVLSPELEHGDPSHRLCLHYRDFPQNGYVADSIVEAVRTSRRTLVVLSKNFLVHEWARYDVKCALHDVLRARGAGGGRAIIIVLGEVPSRELDPDLRVILKSNTSIHWADRMFWEKLRFYLPPGAARANPSSAAHYSLPIYEVPHHLPNHHHALAGLQHKIYEQRTLESQLTAKLY